MPTPMGFAYTAPGYAARAMAGLPMDPADGPATLAPASTVAAAPQPAPQAAPNGAGEPFKPGILDILQGMIFNGQSPADAAMAARQRDYQAKTMAIMADTLQNASPDQRKAMLLNPGELGKAISSRFQSMALKQGETRDNGEGGPPSVTAPVMGFDEKSGRGFTSLPGITVPNGPSLGGDISVSPTGAVVSGRTGLTGQTVSIPEIVPPGSAPQSFTPKLSGFTAPQIPGQQSAPTPISAQPAAKSLLNAQGSLDPAAFFKTFVLPHEGGWNARDLNGSPTKYGINQASNPGVDVSKISPDDAAGIFASKYFPASANLPPALAAVNADTSFINPRKAGEFLAASGGDPSKYMDLRDAWMAGIVQKYPAAQKYAQAWANRNADLRAVAGQLGGAGSAAGDGSGFSGPAPKAPSILDPGDPANAEHYKSVAPGTVLQRAADGTTSILQPPEFSPSERSKMRQQFLESEGYKGNAAASSALQALTQNIGKMTGPSAYSILDTFARTINPGAVARQGTLSAIEDSLGLPAHLVGGLQNIVGQGKIPLQTQQQILDAVTPFAQAHWDQARQFFDANTALAQSKHLDPNEVTAPIGTRPARMIATLGGALSQDDVLKQAKAALAKGANPVAVAQRLHAMGISQPAPQ